MRKQLGTKNSKSNEDRHEGRGGWKRLSDEAVKKLRAAPHPDKGNKRKRERDSERGESASERERCVGYLNRFRIISRRYFRFPE